MSIGKVTKFFNRGYIFIHGCFDIVMLVFRGVNIGMIEAKENRVSFAEDILILLVTFCFFLKTPKHIFYRPKI